MFELEVTSILITFVFSQCISTSAEHLETSSDDIFVELQRRCFSLFKFDKSNDINLLLLHINFSRFVQIEISIVEI